MSVIVSRSVLSFYACNDKLMCSVVVEVMGHLMHIKWHIATKSSYWRHNCKFYANFVVFSDFWAGWSIFGACNTSAFLIKFISHSMFSWFFHIVKNVKSQRKTRETFWHFACIHYTCFWLVFNGSLLSLWFWFWFFEICISELLWRFSVPVSSAHQKRERESCTILVLTWPFDVDWFIGTV